MAKKKLLPIKNPPTNPIESIQLDLFSHFLSNNDKDISNTIEYWERIPKYFLTVGQQKQLRTSDGLAKPYEHRYSLKGKDGCMLPYKVEIQPALIKGSDGEYKAFFPSKAEETIEEVLKKILTDQQYAFHDPEKMESWVRFTYGMIRRELERMGCGKPYKEIKQSLAIMSKCILTVIEDGKEIYTGSILQDYCSVDRGKYLDASHSTHVARLPVFISHAINTLEYRQYNYNRFMECKEQLSRFIYKRLINRFINANYTNDYHFLYSDIKQASGLLQQGERENRKKVISALNELIGKCVILSYKTDERKEGRKIIDVKYIVLADPLFVSEQKAANKRQSIDRDTAQKAGLSVDK